MKHTRVINFSIRVLFFALLSACYSTALEKEPDDVVQNFGTDNPIIFEVIKIRPDPRIGKYWHGDMPSFIFCNSSGISDHRASQGIEYWKRLGYPIENVRYDVDTRECFDDPRPGTVIISLIDNTIDLGSNIAVTRVFYYAPTRQILSAKIYLISGYANRERLIEHEIGHALGWNHYSRYLHIMHPEYDRTGHDSHGLRYLTYLNLSRSIF